METNNPSLLDSGVRCVKFAMVNNSKTVDSKDVGTAGYILNLLWREFVVCGPWIDRLLQNCVISYSRGMSGYVLGTWLWKIDMADLVGDILCPYFLVSYLY